jgi:hypothetical protein
MRNDYAARLYAARLNAQADAINHTPRHIHVGVGLCAVCRHYGADCTGRKLKGNALQQRAEQMLASLARAQAEMWERAEALEALLGITIDTTADLGTCTVSRLTSATRALPSAAIPALTERELAQIVSETVVIPGVL